jgi:hypothetical protein
MSMVPMEEGIVPNGNLVASSSNGNSGVLKNIDKVGIRVGINIVTNASGTLTVTISGRDASNTLYTILASAGLTGTGFTELLVYPGCTAANNTVANAPLPPSYEISWTISSGPITATISAATQN